MPNVVKCAMRFALGNNRVGDAEFPVGDASAVLTFHAQAVDSHAAPDEDDRAAIAAIALAWWQEDGDYAPRLRDAYPPTTLLELVDVQTVSPSISAVETYVNLLPAGTSVLPETLPPQCAFLVSLRTSIEDRRTRGRMFFPPLALLASDISSTGGIPQTLRMTLGQEVASLARRILALEGPSPTWALAVYSRASDDSLAVLHYEIPDRVCTIRPRNFRPLGYVNIGLDGELA